MLDGIMQGHVFIICQVNAHMALCELTRLSDDGTPPVDGVPVLGLTIMGVVLIGRIDIIMPEATCRLHGTVCPRPYAATCIAAF